MNNQEIANIFEEIGNLLDIEGANRFRVLAYKNAAENIKGMGRELKDLFQDPDVKIAGIGPDLHSKIVELLFTGKCTFHQELLSKYGHGLLDILKIRGIGPKKVGLFYKELGIDNLEKLKDAAEKKLLSKLPRMGEKSELEILQALEEHTQYHQRMLLSEALPLAEQILEYLKPLPEIEKLSYAGSLRRRKESVGDLDILVSPTDIKHAPLILEYFQKFPLINNVIASGPTKSSAILKSGVQVDLRVVEKKSFGAALHYFTGSKDHNVQIRALAQKAHKKINEYGLFQLPDNPEGEEKFIIGDTEEHLYQAVGLEYIAPTLREAKGEFEASVNGELPVLVEAEDLIGDFNINTNYGDGELSLTEIVELYSKQKFQFITISDQLSSPAMPAKLTEATLQKQIQEIDTIQKKHPKLKIFKSVKISLEKDGSFHLNQELIDQLDFLIIKINNEFNLPENLQTARYLKALEAPKVKIISCPTGRIINQKLPLNFSLEKILEYSQNRTHQKQHNPFFLEINGQPDRLDLPDNLIKQTISHHQQLVLSSDFKKTSDLDNLQKYGLWTAQRGWAQKKNLLNSQSLSVSEKSLMIPN